MRTTVTREQDGLTLTLLLRQCAPDVPPWAVREALRRREVRVDGERVSQDVRVREGQEVRAFFPKSAVAAREVFADVGGKIDAVPVDRPDEVALLQPCFALVGAAVHESGDGRGRERFRLGEHQQDENEADEEVHRRARNEDNDALPRALARKRARIVHLLVLARHGAKAADRQAAQGVERLPLLLFPDGRAHADGELLHPHAAGLRREKVAQLVHGDEHAEHENCENDIHASSFQTWK